MSCCSRDTDIRYMCTKENRKIIKTNKQTYLYLLCREEVYSCWSTASSARVNNYGARIDFILLAEPAAAAAQPYGNEVDAHEHHSCDVAIPVGAAGLVHAR